MDSVDDTVEAAVDAVDAAEEATVDEADVDATTDVKITIVEKDIAFSYKVTKIPGEQSLGIIL